MDGGRKGWIDRWMDGMSEGWNAKDGRMGEWINWDLYGVLMEETHSSDSHSLQ